MEFAFPPQIAIAVAVHYRPSSSRAGRFDEVTTLAHGLFPDAMCHVMYDNETSGGRAGLANPHLAFPHFLAAPGRSLRASASARQYRKHILEWVGDWVGSTGDHLR